MTMWDGLRSAKSVTVVIYIAELCIHSTVNSLVYTCAFPRLSELVLFHPVPAFPESSVSFFL
jgi:hypothetical protein